MNTAQAVTVNITQQQTGRDGGRYEASVGFVINVAEGETPEQTVAHWQAVAHALVQSQLHSQTQTGREQEIARSNLRELIDHVNKWGAGVHDHNGLAALIVQLPDSERNEWRRRFAAAAARYNTRTYPQQTRREWLYVVGDE